MGPRTLSAVLWGLPALDINSSLLTPPSSRSVFAVLVWRSDLIYPQVPTTASLALSAVIHAELLPSLWEGTHFTINIFLNGLVFRLISHFQGGF
jgi:hypothetical protein